MHIGIVRTSVPLFNQGGAGSCSELQPSLELVLCVLTDKEPSLSQEYLFQSGTNTLLI